MKPCIVVLATVAMMVALVSSVTASEQLYFNVNSDPAPNAIAIDPSGNPVYVQPPHNSCVVVFALGTQATTVLAGTCILPPSGPPVGVPGPATAAKLGTISGIAYGSKNNMYVGSLSLSLSLSANHQRLMPS